MGGIRNPHIEAMDREGIESLREEVASACVAPRRDKSALTPALSPRRGGIVASRRVSR
jgi:hypothetical protein